MTTAARASGESRVGWLLPVGPGRVAMWQLAVLAALAALATGFEIGPVTLTVLVLTGLLVVATSVRVGGLWVPVGGRVRALCVAAQAIHTTGAAPVHVLEPGCGSTPTRTGSATARVSRPWRVTTSRWCGWRRAAHPEPKLLVSVLHKAISREDYPISGARLVVLAVPATPWPVRMHWLALRYRPADAPWAALARGGGETGCRKAVASAAQRLVSDLAGAGCAGAILDAPSCAGNCW